MLVLKTAGKLVELHFIKLIDSYAADVHAMSQDLSLQAPVLYYARVLSFYLQGDLERLEKLRNSFSQSAASFPTELRNSLQVLTELRLCIRKKDLSEARLLAWAKESLPNIFAAELHFCLSLAWEKMGDDKLAAQNALQAANLYREHGCARKAMRARYNYVSAESRVYPHKNFVSEVQAIIGAATRTGDLPFKGMALTMLSREYQVIGLGDKAEAMARESVALLEPERGAIHFYYAILHLAHILLEGGKKAEAKNFLQEAELATFPEVQAARKLLLAGIDPAQPWDSVWERDLLPTWRNRMPKILHRARLTNLSVAAKTSELEERLLKFAHNGPIEKWELIERLYPERLSPLILENRFKNLVARVRKKYPGCIRCEAGRYYVEKLPV